jgi:hypothetical protein
MIRMAAIRILPILELRPRLMLESGWIETYGVLISPVIPAVIEISSTRRSSFFPGMKWADGSFS